MNQNFRRVPPPPPPNFKRPPFNGQSAPQTPQPEIASRNPAQETVRENTFELKATPQKQEEVGASSQPEVTSVKTKKSLSENARKGLLIAASAASFALAIVFFVLFVI